LVAAGTAERGSRHDATPIVPATPVDDARVRFASRRFVRFDDRLATHSVQTYGTLVARLLRVRLPSSRFLEGQALITGLTTLVRGAVGVLVSPLGLGVWESR
jgi:hypothetical protein